jgi:hypothetical protein
MAEQDLSGSLTALAEHAGRTGQLPIAADIRARGDRRRRYAGSAGLGLVVAVAFSAGIAFAQPRVADERPVVPPVPPASQPGPESPAVSPPPVSRSPAVSSAPAVSIPPGVPQSPIKAPPPEFSVPPGTPTPAPTSERPLSTVSPGVPPPTLPYPPG